MEVVSEMRSWWQRRGHRFGRPCFCRAGTLFVFPLLCVILNTIFSYTAPQMFPMSGKQSTYEGTRATSCKCVLFNVMQFQMFDTFPCKINGGVAL